MRSRLVGIVLVVGVSVSAFGQAEPLKVVLVMSDDRGYPDMGCHGNPVVQTPNLDKLAASGVQFSDFHVNPFCSPT